MVYIRAVPSVVVVLEKTRAPLGKEHVLVLVDGQVSVGSLERVADILMVCNVCQLEDLEKKGQRVWHKVMVIGEDEAIADEPRCAKMADANVVVEDAEVGSGCKL